MIALPSVAMSDDQTRARLAELETIIAAGLPVFEQVGLALLDIRNDRLYRLDFETFEQYLEERWELKRQRAYELMSAAEIKRAVSENSDIAPPANEAQAAALAPAFRRGAAAAIRVWEKAVDTAPPGKVTAQHVKRVAQAEFEPALAVLRQDMIEAPYDETVRLARQLLRIDPKLMGAHAVNTRRSREYRKLMTSLGHWAAQADEAAGGLLQKKLVTATRESET